jgi:hypothetical protein
MGLYRKEPYTAIVTSKYIGKLQKSQAYADSEDSSNTERMLHDEFTSRAMPFVIAKLEDALRLLNVYADEYPSFRLFLNDYYSEE